MWHNSSSPKWRPTESLISSNSNRLSSKSARRDDLPGVAEGPAGVQLDSAVRAVASARRLGSRVSSSVMASLWLSANMLTSRKVIDKRAATAISVRAARVVASRDVWPTTATPSATTVHATGTVYEVSPRLGKGAVDGQGVQLAMATSSDEAGQSASSVVPTRYEPADVWNRYTVSATAKPINPAASRPQRNSLRQPSIGSMPAARANRTKSPHG